MSLRRVALAVPLAVPLAAASLYACGSSQRGGFPTSEEPGALAPEAGVFAADGAKVGQSTVEGKVFAPNGTLPIAGALVYVTAQEPAPIPDGVFCDKCVEVQEGTFAYSGADGSFTLTVPFVGEHFFVVQKGQFRRVRRVTLKEGDTKKLDKSVTTFPPQNDPARGDSIPKMLVLQGLLYDHIDYSLAELGITELTLVGENGIPHGDRKLLHDPKELAKYNVIFLPCSNQSESDMTSQEVKDNLKAWVAAGGRLYVTDWSYEYVRQPFGQYISWVNEGLPTDIGNAVLTSPYDAPATAVDPGLAAWLTALGHGAFEVKGNYTTIAAVKTLPGVDENGSPVDVTPKVWVTSNRGGKQVPATVSFQHACGRVLFSTYHTESGIGSQLMAQEKALLHVLLEVDVCVGAQSIPR